MASKHDLQELEIVSLVARETPRASDFKTYKEIQATKAELKNRMVVFLALI
jgi:hypothetical protein